MSPSFSLVLASCLVGAPGDVLTQANCVCCQQGAYLSTSMGVGGLFARLRNGYHPQRVVYYAQPAPLMAPRVTTAPQAPVGGIATVTTMRPSNEQLKMPALPPVAKKDEDKVGHDESYQWITGHLYYVHSEGGRWILRYGLTEEVDRFGGSVVLAPGVEMRNYREGDLVCVYGDVLDQRPASPALGGALYRVNSINMVERSDP